MRNSFVTGQLPLDSFTRYFSWENCLALFLYVFWNPHPLVFLSWPWFLVDFLVLHKICENTGFHWPAFYHIKTESRKNTGQWKPVFSYILCVNTRNEEITFLQYTIKFFKIDFHVNCAKCFWHIQWYQVYGMITAGNGALYNQFYDPNLFCYTPTKK